MALDPDAVKDILIFLERAVAAGVGAWAAFRLQAATEARKQRGDRAQALREALFVLVAQRNSLLAIDSSHLAALKNDPERHLLLHPAVAFGASQVLDFRKLGFLTAVKDSDLLSRLDFAQVRFNTALGVLGERGAIHFRLQERLAVSRAAAGEVTSAIVSSIVGREIVLQLKELTDSLYRSVEDALDTNRACLDAVQQVMREQFPGERVPRVIEDGPKA